MKSFLFGAEIKTNWRQKFDNTVSPLSSFFLQLSSYDLRRDRNMYIIIINYEKWFLVRGLTDDN